jgi:hypothetical protein
MRKILLASALAFLSVSSAALAGPSYSYTASGVASDGKLLQGTALLTFSDDLSALTIELENTLAQLAGSVSILTNFEFDVLPGVSFSLTGVTAAGTATCVDGSGSSYTCANTIGSISDNSTFFGWGTGGSTSSVFQLAAGDGSYKNYGIGNTSIANCTGSPDCNGLNNGQHIPYLLGPVEFNFAVAGLTAAPTFTDVMFSFGTGPAFVSGDGGRVPPEQIPEPQSLLLVALALIGVAVTRRRAIS